MKKITLFCLISYFSCHASLAQANCKTKKPEKFDIFFSTWSADKQFSLERTIFPLKISTQTQGENASQGSSDYVTRHEFTFAPTTAEHIEANHLQQSMGEITPNTAYIKLFKPDVEWQYEYHFKKDGDCWYFHELKNQKLLHNRLTTQAQ